jgi:hypothetical protein
MKHFNDERCFKLQAQACQTEIYLALEFENISGFWPGGEFGPDMFIGIVLKVCAYLESLICRRTKRNLRGCQEREEKFRAVLCAVLPVMSPDELTSEGIGNQLA